MELNADMHTQLIFQGSKSYIVWKWRERGGWTFIFEDLSPPSWKKTYENIFSPKKSRQELQKDVVSLLWKAHRHKIGLLCRVCLNHATFQGYCKHSA